MAREYLRCPECHQKRVTRRDFSDGSGYACDRCDFSAYVEEEGDQWMLEELAKVNPDSEIQFMYRWEETSDG